MLSYRPHKAKKYCQCDHLHSHSHPHTHTLTLTLSHSHSHTHTHTPIHTHRYDGPCYVKHPNLSVNPSGKKRMPRIHCDDCEKEQAQLIYEKRFGVKRKRRRDGEG